MLYREFTDTVDLDATGKVSFVLVQPDVLFPDDLGPLLHKLSPRWDKIKAWFEPPVDDKSPVWTVDKIAIGVTDPGEDFVSSLEAAALRLGATCSSLKSAECYTGNSFLRQMMRRIGSLSISWVYVDMGACNFACDVPGALDRVCKMEVAQWNISCRQFPSSVSDHNLVAKLAASLWDVIPSEYGATVSVDTTCRDDGQCVASFRISWEYVRERDDAILGKLWADLQSLFQRNINRPFVFPGDPINRTPFIAMDVFDVPLEDASVAAELFSTLSV
jgi:hypothetical protein